MGRNLLLVTLVAIIFTLLIPLTNHYYASERAFTPDNLVKIQLEYE
jgi:hypothetical protein